jgi:hypothetical protein
MSFRVLFFVSLAAVFMLGCGAPNGSPPRLLAAPPPAVGATCVALAKPRGDLDRLAEFVERPDSRLLHPDLLASELDADAALAHEVTPADPEVAKVAVGAGDLLTALAGRARNVAASTHDGEEAAIAAMRDTINGGVAVRQKLHRLCDGGPPRGRLAPEVIQKIVRADLSYFQACYDDGLRRDPKLMGRVSTHFVIARDGSVRDVRDAEREPDPFGWEAPGAPVTPVLPDAQVRACVVAGFRKLAFPAPEGGFVTVTYPIMFSPIAAKQLTEQQLAAWRPALDNYTPVVTRDNVTTLGPARVPFANYLVTIHNRIHPIFAEEYLEFFSGLPKDDMLNDMTIFTSLEIVLDKNTGRIVRMGVIKSSGSTAYDVAVLKSVSRAAPFGKAPDIIASPDGNVYLHWDFHRDPFDACTPRNARPFLLARPP